VFRFSFAGEKVTGFIKLTFDDMAFRHFMKKCSRLKCGSAGTTWTFAAMDRKK